MRVHEFGDLISSPEAIISVQAISEGIVRNEIVRKTFLFGSPVKELGSEGVVGVMEFEDFGDEIGGNAAELVEVGDEVGGPGVVVFAEGVDDEAGDGGEAGEGGGGGGGGGRGGGEVVWVPVSEVEGFGGFGFGFGSGSSEGLAIGEEAAADGGAVLGGLAVAVEEV